MKVKGPNPIDVLPPTQDPNAASMLQVMQLKRLYRQGWLKRGVGAVDCESVADHSFSVAMLALIAPLPSGVALDRTKAALMALVHELGEVYAGDITPVDGVAPEEKTRLERESVERVLEGHGEAGTLSALWEEFETGATAEGRWVRELDRLEMGLQAALYRAEGWPHMEEFIASADRSVRDASLRKLLASVTGADPGT